MWIEAQQCCWLSADDRSRGQHELRLLVGSMLNVAQGKEHDKEGVILAQNDLRRPFGEQPKGDGGAAVAVNGHHGTHRFASRVERVHFAEAIFGHTSSNGVVVLTE